MSVLESLHAPLPAYLIETKAHDREFPLSHIATPLPLVDRIHALDTTRGFAVLGILLMNIWSFAGPQPIYNYPIAAADWGGAPLQTWALMHTLFEGSQRALFSLLFGAGMLLMVNRLGERTPGTGSAGIYYRRLGFLMLFGLFDMVVLLWPADILFIYAFAVCCCIRCASSNPETCCCWL